MNTVRLNITLPSDVGAALKSIKNKSAFTAEAIRERLAKEEHDNLVLSLREGYAAAKEEDKRINEEWNCTIGDGIA